MIVTGAPTLTTAVTELVHPAGLVPNNVYVVLTKGCATTLAPVLALNPIEGAH